jgi:energy-coupling factor transporter transmembrane protein EcfT
VLIISAVLLPGKALFIAFPLIAITVYIFDSGILLYFRKSWFWIWLMGGVLILPLIVGGNEISVLGIGYSLNTLNIVLRMALRSNFILWGSAILRRHIPPMLIADRLSSWGFKRLALYLPLSLYLAPILLEKSWRVVHLWRERGGWRKRRGRNFVTLITSLQISWVREAEDLAIALTIAEMGE